MRDLGQRTDCAVCHNRPSLSSTTRSSSQSVVLQDFASRRQLTTRLVFEIHRRLRPKREALDALAVTPPSPLPHLRPSHLNAGVLDDRHDLPLLHKSKCRHLSLFQCAHRNAASRSRPRKWTASVEVDHQVRKTRFHPGRRRAEACHSKWSSHASAKRTSCQIILYSNAAG